MRYTNRIKRLAEMLAPRTDRIVAAIAWQGNVREILRASGMNSRVEMRAEDLPEDAEVFESDPAVETVIVFLDREGRPHRDRLHERVRRASDPQLRELLEAHLETLEGLADTVRGAADDEEDDLALRKSYLDFTTEILLATDPNNPADRELRQAATELAREAVGDE
jgi:hypothetical protein